MATGFLALNHRNGAVTAQRYLAATPSQIGNSFGTVENSAGGHLAENRIIQFKGVNDLFAFQNRDIYRYNSGTGNWTSVHTFSIVPAGGGEAVKTGIYLLHIGGVPTLCCALKGPSNSWRGATSVDGTTWVETATFNVGAAGSFVYSEIVFQNVIYWISSGAGDILFTYDPAIASISSIGFGGAILNGRQHQHLCVFDNRLFIAGLAGDGGVQHRRIAELVGGSIVTVISTVNSPAPTNSKSVDNTKDCLFTDGSDMFFIFYDTEPGSSSVANGGLNCYKIDSSLAVTDLTDDVIPTSLRRGQGTGDGTRAQARIRALVDSEAAPGSTPVIDLYIVMNDGDPGTSWSVFRWNGDAALIGNAGTADAVGGEVAHALSFDQRSDGGRFWTLDELHIVNEDISPAIGGERISFRLYSASGTETVNLALYYSLDGSANLTQGTPANPSAGSLNGLQVEGLTADNTTLYTVDHNVVADGIANGTTVALYTRVFV